jgi:hypothetical protein
MSKSKSILERLLTSTAKGEVSSLMDEIQDGIGPFVTMTKLGVLALQAVRPVIQEPLRLIAGELKTVFTEDLKPFLELFEQSGDYFIRVGALRRAKTVEALLDRQTNGRRLTEETCLAIVLDTENGFRRLAESAQKINSNKK